MQLLVLLYIAALTRLQKAAVWLSTQRFSRHVGQGLVEYGLILVLIMVVCVGIIGMTGMTISEVWYTKIVNNPALR